MANMGVVDLKTYFDRLAGPIALCTLIGAVYGGFSGSFSGFFWYGTAGLAAPAALVWLAIAFCYCAVILGVFFLAWAAIICGFFWMMSL